jgi:hypothetical protein
MVRSSSSSYGSCSTGTRLDSPRRPSWIHVGCVLGLALATLALDPEPISGQERSVLSLLDTEGRSLEVDGVAREGTLTSDDLVTGSGQRVQAWELRSVPGPVQVDLRSDDFDAFLYVLPAGGGPTLEDDDSGGELNSRVCLEDPGGYTVVAASLGGGLGSFTLEVAADPDGACASGLDRGFDDERDVLEALSAVVPDGALQIPGTETFRFDGTEPRVEGRPVRAWTFRGEEGERFALTHRSPGIDTYLYLTGPGLPAAVQDDDSAGDFDARLCVELPESGEFTVYAAPFSADDLGALHRLENARGADAEMACDRAFSSSPAMVIGRLLELETQGREVEVGDAVTGTLSPEQLHPESGEPIQPWRLNAAPGTRVFVDVVSDDFDPTVRAVWPGIEEELMNDDFGEGCNSRLEFTVPSDGPVSILPGSWSPGGQGEFLLRVSANPGPLEEGGCGAGGGFESGFGPEAASWEMVGRFAAPVESLALGTEQDVVLGEASTLVVQGIRARGWQVVIDEPGGWVVEALSDEVDPVLYVMGPSLDEPLFDDDSAGSLDSRVEVADAEPGRWIVVVGALGEATGAVRVRLLRQGPG